MHEYQTAVDKHVNIPILCCVVNSKKRIKQQKMEIWHCPTFYLAILQSNACFCRFMSMFCNPPLLLEWYLFCMAASLSAVISAGIWWTEFPDSILGVSLLLHTVVDEGVDITSSLAICVLGNTSRHT